jgi:hypothetical protein
MVLQADVARLGTFVLPFRLVPLFLRWQVGTSRIKRRDALPIEVHKNPLARQRDDQCLPFFIFERADEFANE